MYKSPPSSRAVAAWAAEVDTHGFAICEGVFGSDIVERVTGELQQALLASRDSSQALRDRKGALFGGRNLLAVYPAARTLCHTAPLAELLHLMLGPQCGLVRALFFDKPPERSWSLPWHKDLTIAVRDNRLPSRQFARPTVKAGVPHVEAPPAVLEAMLTLRVHLDDVTPANGPLQVIRGSHRQVQFGTGEEGEICSILLRSGDVLAMRPLLTHSSIASQAGTAQHRRILHLEFSGLPILPDGCQWFDFLPVPKLP